MKKFAYISTLLAVGLVLTFSNCRKQKIDPCENVVCEEGERCVDGKCVPMRKK